MGYVEDLWGRRRHLPDIKLPRYEVSMEGDDTVSQTLNFNPLLGSLGKIEKQKNPLIAEYEKLLEGCRGKKDSDAVIAKAKKDHVVIKNNTGFISQAERQCVNARIQGCLGPNTYILTKERGIVPISSVSNQSLHVWDGKDWTKALVLPSGRKRKCVISFRNHQQMICSPDHKFLTVDTRGQSKSRFKRCKELNVKDHVLLSETFVQNGCPYVSYKATRSRVPHNLNMWSFDQIESDYIRGVLLGRLASDGSIFGGSNCKSHPHLRWIVAEHEKDLVDFICKALPFKTTVRKGIPQRGKYPIYTIDVTSTTLVEEVMHLNIKHEIHPQIMSNVDMLRGFIAGYFDGDGTASNNHVNLTWGKQADFTPLMKDMQKALLILGIRSYTNVFNSCHRLSIAQADVSRFQSTIGFVSNSKKEAIGRCTCGFDEHVYGRNLMITDIQYTDEYIDMYDVCDTERGYFVADGVITHNSAASMSKRALIKIWQDPEMKKMQFIPLILVHDEIIGECLEEYADQAAARLSEIMKHAAEPECVVPFKVDAVAYKAWYAEEYFDDLQKEFDDLCKTNSVEDSINKILTSHTEITKEDFDSHIKLPEENS